MGVAPQSVAAVIAALDRAGVRYVVVGGLAVVAHGYVRETKDIDLIVELVPANALAAIQALAQLGYRPSVPVALLDFADPSKRAEWAREKDATVLNLHSNEHPAAGIDLFIKHPFDFEQAYSRARRRVVAPGTEAPVVGLDALIKMKTDAARGVDLADVRQLESIRERIRDQGGPPPVSRGDEPER